MNYEPFPVDHAIVPSPLLGNHWKVIRRSDASSRSEVETALKTLCGLYSRPIQAYLIACGYGGHDAQLAFMQKILRRVDTLSLGRGKSHFCRFVLSALQRFVVESTAALYRQAGSQMSASLADQGYRRSLASVRWKVAEGIFNYEWASALMRHTVNTLCCEDLPEEKLFEELKYVLYGDEEHLRFVRPTGYWNTTGVSTQSRLSLRKRFIEALFYAVSHTVADELGGPAELRALRARIAEDERLIVTKRTFEVCSSCQKRIRYVSTLGLCLVCLFEIGIQLHVLVGAHERMIRRVHPQQW